MNRPTILVVDDDIFFRRLYSDVLKSDLYHVETASSGNEALDRLTAGDISLVLTDMVMPGIDGLELLERVRHFDPQPDVILATGHATVETAIKALKTGAKDYLLKPFDPDELKHIVHSCLEQRRVLNENALLKGQIRLYKKGQSLASSLDIETLLTQAVNTFLQETGGTKGFAFLTDDEKPDRFYSCIGLNDEEAGSLLTAITSLNGPISSMRLISRKIEPSPSNLPDGVDSLLTIPLVYKKKCKGGVVIFPATDEGTTSLQTDNLQFLSEQMTLGFQNAYRYQGAKDLIYTDDLTGLHNYRYLMMVLDQEVRRAERYGLDFSLIFIDLDYFKNINDAHGHLAGSHALREVAQILRTKVREVDLLFRYGGDEFTALLVETDPIGAAVVAERIRKAIEEYVFLASAGTPSRLTATVGYASYPKNASDKKEILDLADRAMYEGKRVRNTTRGARESQK